MGTSTSITPWEDTMTSDGVYFCLSEIWVRIQSNENYYNCVSDFRAARAWKSTQRRRFFKLRGCCGSEEWIVHKWSWRKFRFDKYLVGFNFGH